MAPAGHNWVLVWQLLVFAAWAGVSSAGQLDPPEASPDAGFTVPAVDEAVARRLWGLQMPDTSQLLNQTGALVQNAEQQAGAAVNGAAGEVSGVAQSSFGMVKDTFTGTKGLVDEGIKVVEHAIDASSQFSSDMSTLFAEFAPLQPIFAATHGIVPLLTSPTNLRTLVGFLVDLLKSAAELASIGSAVGAVSHVFSEILNLFHSELSKLNPAASAGGAGRRLQLDYTALLGGLDFARLKADFDDMASRARTQMRQVEQINETVYPLLQGLEAQLGSGRRLSATQVIQEIGHHHEKYESALLSIVPTWKSVEGLAIDVCGQTDGAMRQMTSLQCRVENFAGNLQLPAVGGLSATASGCDTQAENTARRAECPGEAQSAKVGDMLSESAGLLGWICVSVEYMIKNSHAVCIFLTVCLAALGCLLAFFGYRCKDCEFWVEGLIAGFVVWSIVISIIIVYFGVCRGEVIDSCDPKWMLLIVCLLSIGCAVATVRAQSVHLFLAGFDLGAILGGFLFISQFHEQIFHTFVSADDQQAKIVMAGFLGAALLCGLLLGGLTVCSEKAVIVIGTAGIGGFLIVVAVCVFFPHWLGWWDLGVWIVLTIIASIVQYTCTAPSDDDARSSKDEELAPLFADGDASQAEWDTQAEVCAGCIPMKRLTFGFWK